MASEVKDLARQTAGATDDIRHRVEEIQKSTGRIEAIRSISQAILDVNNVSRTIAAAVEEQSITAKEIAANVADSSVATESVAKRIAQSAGVAREISQNMAHVDRPWHAAEGASSTQNSSQQLTRVAQQLQTVVAQFKIDHAE